MNCPQKDVDLLVRRAAGRLSPAEEAVLEQHLRNCSECREAAAAQRSVWNALDEWSAEPVSEDFDQRLWARIAARDAESIWSRFWQAVAHGLSWKVSLSVAGACAIVLAILLLRAPVGENGPQGPAPAIAAQKTIDIDQVESALDDVDMLNQLGVAAPAPAKADSGS